MAGSGALFLVLACLGMCLCVRLTPLVRRLAEFDVAGVLLGCGCGWSLAKRMGDAYDNLFLCLTGRQVLRPPGSSTLPGGKPVEISMGALGSASPRHAAGGGSPPQARRHGVGTNGVTADEVALD